MIQLLLVAIKSQSANRIDTACQLNAFEHDKWHQQDVTSIPHATIIVGAMPAAILLFEFAGISARLKSELRDFRKASRSTPVCAVLSERAFHAGEFVQLTGLGVRGFVDQEVLDNPEVLRSLLDAAAAMLVGNRVLMLLQTGLEPSAFNIADAMINELTSAADPGKASHIDIRAFRRLRTRHGGENLPHAETFEIALRLLFLTVLVQLRGVPLSKVYHLAGFPTADDARKLLLNYTGVRAVDLARVESATSAQANLTQILTGKNVPSHLAVRRRKQENRRTGEQENRRTGEQENRRTGRNEK